MSIINITVNDEFTFTELLATNQHVIHYNDVLHFSESYSEADPSHVAITDPVNITDTAHVNTVRHRSISDTLPMFDSPYKGPLVDVADTFSFTQAIHVYSFTPHIIDTLAFTETIHFHYGRTINDTLTFHETINAHLLGLQAVNDTLIFSDAAVASIYSPAYIVSKIPDEPGSGRAVLLTPTITAQTTVSFHTNTYSLTLRAPDFGNNDSLNFVRIQRTTRGNELITYRDPAWNRSETFTLDFSYILDSDALLAQTFINNTLGQLVTYTDYEGNSWLGIVQTPQLAIKKSGRYNNTFTLTFEVTSP